MPDLERIVLAETVSDLCNQLVKAVEAMEEMAKLLEEMATEMATELAQSAASRR